jgi:hypothetical protein
MPGTFVYAAQQPAQDALYPGCASGVGMVVVVHNGLNLLLLLLLLLLFCHYAQLMPSVLIRRTTTLTASAHSLLSASWSWDASQRWGHCMIPGGGGFFMVEPQLSVPLTQVTVKNVISENMDCRR